MTNSSEAMEEARRDRGGKDEARYAQRQQRDQSRRGNRFTAARLHPCPERFDRHNDMIMRPDDLTSIALFLDFDGTLVDIASTPDAVTVPNGLTGLLTALTNRLDGALAILTGRAIADIDGFLAPLQPIAAGIHGAEVRTSPGGLTEAMTQPIDDAVVEAVLELARVEPGTVVELKSASVAVHYRMIPSAEPRIEKALHRILDTGPDHLILCRGRKVLEIVPRRVSKGTALQAIMALPAFRGRRPVMIGDDVSDQTAFEAAVHLGGLGLRSAGGLFKPEEADFSGPREVRAWLCNQVGMLAL